MGGWCDGGQIAHSLLGDPSHQSRLACLAWPNKQDYRDIQQGFSDAWKEG
jgi:hypothetical protein